MLLNKQKNTHIRVKQTKQKRLKQQNTLGGGGGGSPKLVFGEKTAPAAATTGRKKLEFSQI